MKSAIDFEFEVGRCIDAWLRCNVGSADVWLVNGCVYFYRPSKKPRFGVKVSHLTRWQIENGLSSAQWRILCKQLFDRNKESLLCPNPQLP